MTTNHPPISIIIVTWNSAKHISECLASLGKQSFQNFEVILIDNGSRDNTLNRVGLYISKFNITIKPLKKNLGFAAANNIGVRLAKGHWIALLNADAFPESDWLDKLLQAAKKYPEFSCFSSRQIQANNPNFLDGAGDAYHISGMAWRIGIGYPSNQFGLKSEEIFSPCAAAAMYLREAFLEVGGFDEDFFSYFEDVDLGFRLQLNGYRCLYLPSAIVHHVGSATFGERSDFAFYHAHRNLIWTFAKNMPSLMLWLYLPAHIMANIIYMIYYALRGRGKILWEAKKDALRGLPEALQKRRKIQTLRKITEEELLKVMERGWLQPYLLGYRLRRILSTASQKD